MSARSVRLSSRSVALFLVLLATVICSSTSFAAPPGGWGTIETAGTGTDQITLVNLGGSRYEMGYWYGYLLGNQIGDCWANFSAYAAAGGITEPVYQFAIASMWQSAYFDTAAWNLELQGIAAGAADAGRPDVTYESLLKMQVIPDISEVGCSLFAAWGAATANGETIQMRNLDWTMDAGVQNWPIVAMYHPTDGNMHAVVSFAGMVGVSVGGMSGYGIGISEIMGHFGDAESLNGIPFPVLLRDVLYHDTSLAETLTRVRNATRTNQYHYAFADPNAPDPKGRLLFTSGTRCDEYGDVQIVNHPVVTPAPYHEALNDVIYWKNHNGRDNDVVHDAIAACYGTMDAADAIGIARIAGVSGTLTSIIYHNSANAFYVAFANGLDPAQNQGYVYFELPPAVLAVSPSSRSVPYTQGAATFGITNAGPGAMNWTAVPNDTWLTVQPPISGSGDATLSVNHAENPFPSSRSATVTVTAPGAESSPQSVTVMQSGNSTVAMAVTPSVQPVGSDAGNTSFLVTNTGGGTMNWTASITAGSSWLNIADGSSGSNGGLVSVDFTANTQGTQRTGSILVTSSGASGSPKQVTIEQACATLDAPQAVAASDEAYPDRVVITWEPVAGVSKYRVYRCGEDDFTKAAPLGFWASTTFDDWSAGVPTTKATTTDGCGGVTAGAATYATYYYWVVSVNDCGEGEASTCDAGKAGAAKQAAAVVPTPGGSAGAGTFVLTAGLLGALAFARKRRGAISRSEI
ncbi:MAG: BACON domain-containing protein [bacterium]|nr:BACON domain-containing protein [bacterium]